jgi:hypothetical protein
VAVNIKTNKMDQVVIPDNDGNGVTLGFIGTDVEKVNPLNEYKERVRQRSKALNKFLLRRANPFMARFVPESFYETKAEEEWQRHYDRVMNAKVSKNFIDLLSAKTKKDQERLVRGQTLTPDQLAELIFRAHTEHGFTYSKYTAEHLPNGIDPKELPELETWNNGQPHFHYISDKWTTPKDEIIAKLKSKNYPSTSIHIGLNDYGGRDGEPKVKEE